MLEFSRSLGAKGLPTFVTSAQDVNQLIDAFNAVAKDLNLWQYYVLDVIQERKIIKSALEANNVVPWAGPDVAGKTVVELSKIIRGSDQIQGLGKLGSRYGVKVEGGVSAGFVKAAFVDLDNPDALADAWIRIVDVINVPLYKEWEEDARAASENIKNRINYTRLDAHGPKLGEINEE